MSEEEFFNRAINRICKDYDYNFASEFKELYMKKDKEIERLNNIIKEVREKLIVLFGTDDEDINNILEILDKV